MENSVFYKNLLNSYLNTDVLPRTDFSFMIGDFPYLGVPKGGFCPKLATFDFDGVFNRIGAKELYKRVFEEMSRNNRGIERNFPKILDIDERIRTPEDVPKASEALSRIFRECGLTSDQFRSVYCDASEDFLRDSVVRGAEECVDRMEKEMGYKVIIISGCPQEALGIAAEGIGISRGNVHGSRYFFDSSGKFIGLDLLLGHRKSEKKDDLLRKNVQTRYGCCFVFEDDPKLNAPYMKAGINPSVIIGSKRNLNFDVFSFCPEAREDLEELVKEVYKFEYGWVSVHSMEESELRRLVEISKNLRESFSIGLEGKEEFCKSLIEIVEIKQSQRMIQNPEWVKEMIADLIIARGKEETEKMMEKIWKFSSSNIPEVHF